MEHLTHRCSQLPSCNTCFRGFIALSLWNELDLLPKLDLFCLKFQKHFSLVLAVLKFYSILAPGFKNKATDICVSEQSNIYESCKHFVHNPEFIAMCITFIGSIDNFHFLNFKCTGKIVFIPHNWWGESLVQMRIPGRVKTGHRSVLWFITLSPIWSLPRNLRVCIQCWENPAETSSTELEKNI